MSKFFNTFSNNFNKKNGFLRNRASGEIEPDEIIMDSSNLPEFDTSQMEGRLDKPISRAMLFMVMGIYVVMISAFVFQAMKLQIVNGDEYKTRSENNILRPVPVFAGRGVIYDRNGVMLAWNAPGTDMNNLVASRMYSTSTGLAHALGYLQYPSKDSSGFYYQKDFVGVSGVEKYFDEMLNGVAGSRLVEVDAIGKVVSESVVKPPVQGQNITLSIDSRVQSEMYKNLKDIATRIGFSGAAGVIMDIRTGELISLTSYPEFSSQIMSDKTDQNAVKAMLNDSGHLFLNRAVDGLYVPGSIVKPFVALGALTEKTIDADTVIVTTGSISIPNPYDNTKSTLFRDWKNHGAVDMRKAIAVSSDAYFYIVGGGYKDQKGLGILNIDKYLSMFGFGTTTTDGSKSFLMNKSGTIPTPEWKKKTFNEDWYVGNTYHTSIGQYGLQVTPIQITRAVAAIANHGTLITPTIIKGEASHIESRITTIADKDYQVVHEGMRMSTVIGAGKAVNVPYIHIASKSGTAELGVSKANINSWITGFWPYENPKYAFAVLMEHGSVSNMIGAGTSMKQTLNWMNENTPEYFK